MGSQRAGHNLATKQQRHSCFTMLYIRVNQVYVHTHPSFSGFPFRLGYHNPLSRVALLYGACLMAQRGKNLPAMQETQVRSLGQEDPLEKRMATHSSILVWRIPWTEEPGRHQCLELPDSSPPIITFHVILLQQLPLSAVQTTIMSVPKSKFMGNNWNGPCVSHMLILHKEQGQEVWPYRPDMTQGLSYIAAGNAEWYRHSGGLFGSFLQN